MISWLLLGCFILSLIGIGGIILIVFLSKQGQGVSDARQGWIEGTGYQEDG